MANQIIGDSLEKLVDYWKCKISQNYHPLQGKHYQWLRIDDPEIMLRSFLLGARNPLCHHAMGDPWNSQPPWTTINHEQFLVKMVLYHMVLQLFRRTKRTSKIAKPRKPLLYKDGLLVIPTYTKHLMITNQPWVTGDGRCSGSTTLPCPAPSWARWGRSPDLRQRWSLRQLPPPPSCWADPGAQERAWPCIGRTIKWWLRIMVVDRANGWWLIGLIIDRANEVIMAVNASNQWCEKPSLANHYPSVIIMISIVY